MRSRNIKPGFFQNADLVELDALTRLLFIGLWTVADREGRMEDRPKYIKLQILPADNCDCDQMLSDLEKSGFIVRYIVENKKYIQVLNFKKHQSPHMKEPASTMPAPDKHQTSTMPAHLIPDSLNLIPDSPFPTPEESEKMTQPEISALYLKYSGKLQHGGGDRVILQDITKDYPPERIKEAFQTASAASPTNFLQYALSVLRNKEPPKEVLPEDCEFMKEHRRLYGP